MEKDFTIKHELGLSNLPNEVWKDVVGYEGIYMVSNLGRVKSLQRKTRNGVGLRSVKERILKQGENRDGHFNVKMTKNSLQRTRTVHLLVAESFLNHITDGTTKIVVDHINNCKSDNRLENLQLISHRKNLSKDRIGGTSKYAGVNWHKNNKKWDARIQLNKKRISLGSFDCELKAAYIYNTALKNHLSKKV